MIGLNDKLKSIRMPLLLLHGALGSKKQFTELSEVLSCTYDVHTFNFEGHGDNISEADFSIDLFSENLKQYLIENNLDKVDIFGYSMGGYVAMNSALLFPEKIGTIVTLGTKVDWSIESAEKEVKMLNPEKIEEKVPQFALSLQKEHHPSDWKIVMKKTAAMMLALANGKKLQEDDFKKIENKVIVGIGNLDNMVSFEESSWLANSLPNATLVRLENFHHPLNKIDVVLLADFIMNSLDE